MFTPKIIAKIKSPFPTKFGVPRQSGMVRGNISKVVFEKEYATPDALRGLDGFSHIWLIWYFDKSEEKAFTPTVRPPKLGGNTRVGVFATRSPYRPNPIGLSLVKLVRVNVDEEVYLEVEGADLVDGTPILDIKPYLPFVESLPDATGGYTEETSKVRLYVDFPAILLEKIQENHRLIIKEFLSLDPRPGYQHDAERIYGASYYNYDIKFKVDGDTLTVVAVDFLTER